MTQDMSEADPQSFFASVMVCDIRGFSHLSIQSDAVKLFRFINQFMVSLAQAVNEEGGKISNLTGDGFIAYFTHNHDAGFAAVQAVNASINIRRCLPHVSNRLQKNYLLIF